MTFSSPRRASCTTLRTHRHVYTPEYLPEEDVLELVQRHAAALLPLRERLVPVELRLPLRLGDNRKHTQTDGNMIRTLCIARGIYNARSALWVAMFFLQLQQHRQRSPADQTNAKKERARCVRVSVPSQRRGQSTSLTHSNRWLNVWARRKPLCLYAGLSLKGFGSDSIGATSRRGTVAGDGGTWGPLRIYAQRASSMSCRQQ